MKKILILYGVPLFIQIILLPCWFLDLDARYIDASVVSIFIALLSPIYLIVLNFARKDFEKYGMVKTHLLMAFVVCLAEFFHYLGWSEFNTERFIHPDPMTVGLSTGFVKIGIYAITVSFIVSLIIKFIKYR